MITPQQFKLFDENAQWETLRDEEINRRKKVMENINKNRNGDKSEYSAVFPFQGSEPVALFSYNPHAKILASFLSPKGRVSYKHIAVGEDEPFDLNRFEKFISAGKRPFLISLMANGDLFEIEPLTSTLHDPAISKNYDIGEDGEIIVDEKAGIGGTFWGYDQHDALVEAEHFRLRMIEEGKL